MGLRHHDPRGLTSAKYVGVYNVLFGVAVFIVLGSFLVITLTVLLLEVIDHLAVGIVQATGTTMEGMRTRIGLLAAGLATINVGAPGVGAILTIFLAGLAISAAAIVWFSLLIRKALLLVAIVVGPVALAGATWDATKGWFVK